MCVVLLQCNVDTWCIMDVCLPAVLLINVDVWYVLSCCPPIVSATELLAT